MKAKIETKHNYFEVNLAQPIDISIPISAVNSPKAWYVEPAKFEPLITEHFIGDVNLGGTVNFRNIFFNPHGNGTHTECVGHISKEFYSVNKHLTQFFFFAQLVSVTPHKNESGDLQISANQFPTIENNVQAIVIRTLPNAANKLSIDYSNTNPPYFTADVVDLFNTKQIEHWLVDLPSVDKEFDGGVLTCHNKFWNHPQQPILHKTITEFIFVPDRVKDGLYLLNLQFAPFENDASPSKPLLFEIKNYLPKS